MTMPVSRGPSYWLHARLSALSEFKAAFARGWSVLSLFPEEPLQRPDLLTALSLAKEHNVRLILKAPDLDPTSVCELAEMGARAFSLPSVESAAQVITIAGALIAAFPGDRFDLYPVIETRHGVAATSDVAQVPGVAGVIVGPGDLAHAYGIEDFTDLDALAPLIADVSAQVRSAGVAVGSMIFANWIGDNRIECLDFLLVRLTDQELLAHFSR